MQGEQSLNPADNLNPLLNQVFALAFDALGIFLLDGGNAHSRGNGTIARKPGSKDFGHLLGIKPIRLGWPTSTWFEKARQFEHDTTTEAKHMRDYTRRHTCPSHR